MVIETDGDRAILEECIAIAEQLGTKQILEHLAGVFAERRRRGSRERARVGASLRAGEHRPREPFHELGA